MNGTGRFGGLRKRLVAAFADFRGWWALGLFEAAVMAWSHRRDMDPDGLSYTEMAAKAAGNDWSALINGYWSPGYPALLSLALRIFHPSPRYEFQIVHLANFCIFALAFGAFTYFFRSWMLLLKGLVSAETEKLLTAFGCFLFLWSVFEHVGVGLNTPDLTVCGVVFLSAGLVMQVSRPESGQAGYAGLGLALAAAYWVKAVMLPIGIVLIFLLLAFPPTKFAKRRGFVLSGICMLAGSLPLVIMVSRHVGHASYSETGTLNYAWIVNGVNRYWKAEPEPRVSAIHGPRRLREKPVTLEFAEPIDATQPLWYEPSYWAAGTRMWFDPRQQLAALETNAEFMSAMLLSVAALVAGAAVLYAFPGGMETKPAWRAYLWCLCWPAFSFALYALVFIQWRYLSSFFVLFWLAVYGRMIVASPKSLRLTCAVLAVVCGTLAFPWVGHFATTGGRAAADLLHPMPTTNERVADLLERAGLRKGDRIAFAGEGFEVYFARLARLRLVAQIPREDDFWELDQQGRRDLATDLESIGVKALVAKGVAKGRPADAEILLRRNWIVADPYTIIPVGDLAKP